ncbi:MAG TPA: response regulator [Gemmatimonadales bacterium]|jgi:diguanylate cyclase (GGDEF)-like protein|nr:response regulator [Gemmatimonadales bacterium]
MSDDTSPNGLSLALLADDREERTQWLARLLEQVGYVVLRERTARHALERAQAARPDVIIIAAELPDMTGIELCRALLGDGRLTSTTPILLAFSEPATREQRLTALRAGAWECIAPPHDHDEIVLKASVYIRAKLEADRTRTEGLLDLQTGLYNRQGLARRARELSSQAVRDHAAIACVVLAIDPAGAGAAPGGATDVVGRGVHVLQATARRSDVIGRLGSTEFAVLAPGTDASGARRLAERLAGSLQVALDPSPGGGVTPRGMRFGYEAVANMGYAPIEPVELLGRASAALRTGRAEGGGWIRRFEVSGAATG